MDEREQQQEQWLEQQKEARRVNRLAQKKRRRLQQRIVLAVVLLIIILASILVVRGCESKKTESQRGLQTPAQENGEQQAALLPGMETEPDTVIHLAAVGDIMLYDDQLEQAKTSVGSYDFSESLTAVSALTMSADLTIGNLELNFCGEPYQGKPVFRAPEAFAQALQAAGFDLMQTANSASINNGISGLASTIRTLDSAGIAHVGTYLSEEEKQENQGVLLQNINGIRIAFISYTKGVNNLSLPQGSEYAVDLLYEDYYTDYTTVNTKALKKSLDAARALKPDLTVALLHWGSEWDKGITEAQREITDQLLEGGVDVILGSHPHVVGKMETRMVTRDDEKEHRCFVAYSLGNFLVSPAAQDRPRTMESLILNLQITKNGKTGETNITDISYTPLYIAQNDTLVQVLPVRSAIKSNLFPDLQQDLTDTIAHLRSDTESDLDSGK